MRIAVLADPEWPNTNYRARLPAFAFAAHGHDVHLDLNIQARHRPDLAPYDAVYAFRLYEEDTLRRARKLRAAGTPLIWDNDDELTDIPGERVRGAMRSQQAAAGVRAMLELADVVTTTSSVLAARYRELGADHVQVIENYLPDNAVTAAAPRARDHIVVGWTGAGEHRYDLEQLDMRGTLRRILDTHPDVVVASIGIDIGLDSDRYRRMPWMEYEQFLGRLTEFDIGIAPLADTVFNRARSNVKLKEYAAAGLPWLASPIGPYREMGSREGGRLVEDGRWYEELSRLLDEARARRKLAKRAARWGESQTMSRNTHHWQQALDAAVERVTARQAA